MDLESMKKIAADDVLYTGAEHLDKKMGSFAGDAVVWDPVMKVAGFSETNIARGHEEVRRFFKWLGEMPPVKAEIANVFGEGEHVVVEWLLHGGASDSEFTIPCANVYDFEDGKIKSVRMHFDSAHFAEIWSNK